MNLKKLIAAAAVLSAAGSALADNSLPYTDQTGFDSSRARTAVVAEIVPGAAGFSTANNEYRDFTTAGSTLTRADVLAGLENDFAQGRNAIMKNPEFIDSTQFASTGTRDPAHAESRHSAHGNIGNKKSGS